LRTALHLSVGTSSSPKLDTVASSSQFLDVDFVNQLLGSVDHDDPLIQAALTQMGDSRGPTGEPEDKTKKRKGDDV
jgi:hypothetical protein